MNLPLFFQRDISCHLAVPSFYYLLSSNLPLAYALINELSFSSFLLYDYPFSPPLLFFICKLHYVRKGSICYPLIVSFFTIILLERKYLSTYHRSRPLRKICKSCSFQDRKSTRLNSSHVATSYA